MFFIVTATGPEGAVVSTCETAPTAFVKAQEFFQGGFNDVVIADANGLQNAPADFSRLFVASEPLDADATTSRES